MALLLALGGGGRGGGGAISTTDIFFNGNLNKSRLLDSEFVVIFVHDNYGNWNAGFIIHHGFIFLWEHLRII